MQKYRLLTPGPSPVPEETLLELAKPVTFHRSSQFKEMFAEVTADLQYVFRTKNPVLTLTSSGTGAMEAAVANALPPGSKAICLISGRWGERWKNLCKAFGIEAINVTVPYGQAVKPEQLHKALADHMDARAVFATLSETATGVANDIEAFGKLVKPTDKLLIVDTISGLGVIPCETDAWGIDINVTGSQKALMLPPGLAFLSVSDKAWKAIEANTAKRVFYFDLLKYRNSLKENDTPYTPANTLIRALRVSLNKIKEEGIEKVWARHARIAAAARAGIKAMGLELFAERPADGLTVAKMPEGLDSSPLLKQLEAKYGLRLANGQDTLKGKIIRLAHMGYADPFDVLAALSGIELVLLEAGFKLKPGNGVAAAQQVLAEGIKKG
jgi:aspartate aminotransferase-like enzyme